MSLGYPGGILGSLLENIWGDGKGNEGKGEWGNIYVFILLFFIGIPVMKNAGIGCLLPVVCCLLSVVFCLLSGVWCLLSVVCCSLSVVWCLLCVYLLSS